MKFLFSIFLFSSLSLLAQLEVHEWGSINIVTGNQQVYVGDVTDDQSDLPPFVTVWSKVQPIRRPIAVEKPIIYFYSTNQQWINVKVGYPEGVFTQWWPAPVNYAPIFDAKNLAKTGGQLEWQISVTPKTMKVLEAQMPVVANHPWWNIARDVDANLLQTSDNSEVEKFLFYRASGIFVPTLSVDVDENGNFLLKNIEKQNSKEIYTIAVKEDKTGAISYQLSLNDPIISFENKEAAAKHLQSRLEAKGLFPKEAAGMVKIWQENMFAKPGQRAMYLMETEDIDKMMPLNITPKPKKQVRVMLIRFDVLSPGTKKEIENLVTQLSKGNFKERKIAKEKIIKYGRVSEAFLRDTLSKTSDIEMQLNIKEILLLLTPMNPNP